MHTRPDSDRFRNKNAKCLKEQLLTHFDPRNLRMERCLPLAPTGHVLPVFRNQNFSELITESLCLQSSKPKFTNSPGPPSSASCLLVHNLSSTARRVCWSFMHVCSKKHSTKPLRCSSG